MSGFPRFATVLRTAMRTAKRLGLRHAVRTAAATLATLLVVTVLQLPEGYWAVITAVIVMQANLGGSIRAAWSRLAGTAIGAASGTLAAYWLGNTWPALGLAVFFTQAICTAVRPLQQSSRVAGLTSVIVILAGHPGEAPWIVGLHRSLEISVGILTALVVSAICWPSRASRAFYYGLAKIFEDAAAFFSLEVEGRLHEDYNKRRAFALKDGILRTLARCRALLGEASIEGRGGVEGTMRALLLSRAELLFEHVLAIDHVTAESGGKGLHRHLPGELAELERTVAEVLGQLAGHLRRRDPLPALEALETAVRGAREKLATMRRDRAPAAYDLSEVMHFYSFMHGVLACAADAGDIVRRISSLEQG